MNVTVLKLKFSNYFMYIFQDNILDKLIPRSWTCNFDAMENKMKYQSTATYLKAEL